MDYETHNGNFYLAPDYDAITATVAYQDALPFMSIDAHILDHQDDTQQEEEPNRDEILNRRSNKIALEWLDKQEDNNKECSPNLFFPICNMVYCNKEGDMSRAMSPGHCNRRC